MDRKNNDDAPNDPIGETDDEPQEFPRVDASHAKPDESSEDDAEKPGGFEEFDRRRIVGKRIAAVLSPRETRAPAAGESGDGGDLATMTVSALVANYAAYAAAHEALVEQGSRDESMLSKLGALRGEIQKRGIIDVLLPLLTHSPLNPFAHVTAAIDLLSVFEQSERAVRVLTIAARGGRGFLSFLAGFAIDACVRSQLAPLPDKILREASRLYTGLPGSIAQFNGRAATLLKLPPPEKVIFWDGAEHAGTCINLSGEGLSDKYYAQHVGRNEYQIYRSGSLGTLPQDGELYHINRDGALRQTPEQPRGISR